MNIYCVKIFHYDLESSVAHYSMEHSYINVLYLHEFTIELVRMEDLLLAGDFLSLFTSKFRTISKL